MKIRLLVAAAILPLAACMTPATWHKPGASQQDFYMDQGQCQAQAYSVPGAPMLQIAAVYNACMRGKGWQLYRDQ